jgi:hypothetical protein
VLGADAVEQVGAPHASHTVTTSACRLGSSRSSSWYEPTRRHRHECLMRGRSGMLAKQLQKHLRSGRPTRRNVHNTVTGQWRWQICDAVSIRVRPAEVADRAVAGHWEGDLLLGRHWTQIATVVERSTRFTVLVPVQQHREPGGPLDQRHPTTAG